MVPGTATEGSPWDATDTGTSLYGLQSKGLKLLADMSTCEEQ